MDRVQAALKSVSYSEIARRTKTTPGYVSLLFSGSRGAKLETLGKVARALGVSVEDLHGHLMALKGRRVYHRRRRQRTPVDAAA